MPERCTRPPLVLQREIALVRLEHSKREPTTTPSWRLSSRLFRSVVRVRVTLCLLFYILFFPLSSPVAGKHLRRLEQSDAHGDGSNFPLGCGTSSPLLLPSAQLTAFQLYFVSQTLICLFLFSLFVAVLLHAYHDAQVEDKKRKQQDKALNEYREEDESRVQARQAKERKREEEFEKKRRARAAMLQVKVSTSCTMLATVSKRLSTAFSPTAFYLHFTFSLLGGGREGKVGGAGRGGPRRA